MITNRPVVPESILQRINTEYYEKKISELTVKIAKIRGGRAGESNSDIKSEESSLEYYKKEKQKYDAFVAELHRAKSTLSSLSKEESQHSIMYSLIKDALDSVPGLSPKYRKMYERASSREYNKISSKNFKAGKKVLKMSKKISDTMYVFDLGDNLKKTPINLTKMLEKHKMYSLSGLFAEYKQLLNEKNEKSPANLGLDKNGLEQIKTILKTDIASCSQFHSSVGASRDKYNTLLNLKRSININTVTSVILGELLELYEDILKRGRALRALTLILNAFGKTVAKDMPTYKKLEQICLKMEEEIKKIVKKANDKYDKRQIVQLKEKYDVIEKAYGDYLAIRKEYSKGNIAYLRYLEEVGKIRRTMIKALEQFPELNNPKYEIDIVNGVAKDKAKLVPPKEVGEKTVSLDSSPKNPFSQFGSPTSEEDDLLISPPIVISEHLASYETDMYLKYSEYKKSPLGNPNITFLEFLRNKQLNASNSDEKLSELIVLLEKKKARIDTIYKSYLKYRANLKDKNNYLPFYSWVITFFKNDRYDEEFILRKDDDTGYEPRQR